MLVLSGIGVIVAGFLLRFNPLLVVLVAALVTGLAAGMDPLTIVAALGKSFNDTRYISVIWIVLPVIGMLEAKGLQERARAIVASMAGATAGRLLWGYLLLRQLTAAVGLISMAGHAQTVRPLLAPMAVAAAERQGLSGDDELDRIKALAAATDNIGVFFGEDIFLAIGSILLMKGILQSAGIALPPFALSVWAIPSAVSAFLIHGFRLWRLDRRLTRRLEGARP
ncbi:DUF969 domain-containing protein [Novosphingobium lentum]|uniref:DUF969 domain-containing protein n=1 Tax=Novosphingobium lentum TaxID=145287 RepID=UPI000829CBBC|nr:DUF969 domain-containing protein [Novosphingobium lentum]